MTQDKPTAMMELIEWAKDCGDYIDGKIDISGVCDKATELLEKEKTQIVDAYDAGDKRGTKDIPFNAEQYFTQTYKQ